MTDNGQTNVPATTAAATTALAPNPEIRPGMGLVLTNLQDAFYVARMFHSSGMMPVGLDTPQKVFVALVMGAELGISAMQSVQNIAPINGRPAVWGDLMLALCEQSGVMDDFEEREEGEGDSYVATCIVKRKSRSKPTVRSFSMKKAKAAGLTNKTKTPWASYPERMCQMRARSWALRDAFPDVLKGLRAAADIDADQDPREAQTVTVNPTEPAATVAAVGASSAMSVLGDPTAGLKRPETPQEPRSEKPKAKTKADKDDELQAKAEAAWVGEKPAADPGKVDNTPDPETILKKYADAAELDAGVVLAYARWLVEQWPDEQRDLAAAADKITASPMAFIEVIKEWAANQEAESKTNGGEDLLPKTWPKSKATSEFVGYVAAEHGEDMVTFYCAAIEKYCAESKRTLDKACSDCLKQWDAFELQIQRWGLVPPPADDKDAGAEEQLVDDHPWARKNWINLRAGNPEQGTGLSTHVWKNIDRFHEAPKALRDEARAKWAKTYPDADFPTPKAKTQANAPEAEESDSGAPDEAKPDFAPQYDLKQLTIEVASMKQQDPKIFTMGVRNLRQQGKISTERIELLDAGELAAIIQEIKELNELANG
jgi:hypothetical protein